MNQVARVIAVALGYIALAQLSAWLAMDTADAWTVWLASGLILGLLAGGRRYTWPATLLGPRGAAIFAIGSRQSGRSAGYAAIEGHAAWCRIGKPAACRFGSKLRALVR